jgi:putative FmdB family regulatory protein
VSANGDVRRRDQVPTYEYACAECGERLEAVQKFSDDPLTVCPACGGRLRKLFSPVGIVFKGSGFYRTDSRSSSVNGSKVNGSAADSSSTSEKSSGADAKPAGSDSGSPGTTAKSEKKADKGGSGTSSGAGAKVA